MRPASSIRSAVMAFTLAVVFFLSAKQGVFAAEFDQIRIGNDYSYLRVPEGRDYEWCEENCTNDARCKAWTYIKPSRQCRLKYAVTPGLANKCCVSGVKEAAPSDSRRAQCADYATKALQQQDQNLSGQCGYVGEDWNENYKLHFRACLGMSERRQKEVSDVRSRALKRCEAHRKSINIGCQKFAKAVAAIDTAANARNCGLKNEPWFGDYKTVYAWCGKNPKQATDELVASKQAELAVCMARGGGSFVERCDTYAKQALEQFVAARKSDCGFRGAQWSGEYRDYYQWCLKVEPFDLADELESRRISLDRCLTQSGEGEEGKIACDHYARLAAEQTRTNRKLDCGLKGRRWLADYDRHFAWCTTTSRINRVQELKYREDELNKCVERGGGALNELCDEYATRALRQNAENLKRNCRYRGDDWHDSYLRHYQWCAKAKPGETQRKLEERKIALETCHLRLNIPFGRER